MAWFDFDKQLSRLEDEMRAFGESATSGVEQLLHEIGRQDFVDPDQLIRFHEALLYIRAYPQTRGTFDLADRLLSQFVTRVEQLCQRGVEPVVFDAIEHSGLAGTTLHGTFSYGIARWLVERHADSIGIDWPRVTKPERLAAILPRILPLLEEEGLVEQNVPYEKWLSVAAGSSKHELRFLIRAFEESGLPEPEKSRTYDLLEIWIRWDLGRSNVSRTANRRRPKRVFYHTRPLLRRADVSLETEMLSPVKLERITASRAETIVDICREATSVRYRELYGITYPDLSTLVHASVGRGTEIFLWGLPRQRRLPLRAYHAGFTLKNGVPINYIEGISFFDRTELGFNTFYTYRDGESAWTYAQAARVLHQLIGTACISLDPYQVGFNNDEAIDSGAFWFYRKLGFRPTRADLAKLTEAQEKRIAADRSYRTPARILRRLSQAPMVYELPGRTLRAGDWDNFRIRNIGLAVQRRMAARFSGNAEEMRKASIEEVSRALGRRLTFRDAVSRHATESVTLALSLIPDLANWSGKDKKKLLDIIRAKAEGSDTEYLKLLQGHLTLRSAMIEIGSNHEK